MVSVILHYKVFGRKALNMCEQLKCMENDYDRYCLEDLKMIWHAQQSCDLDYAH